MTEHKGVPPVEIEIEGNLVSATKSNSLIKKIRTLLTKNKIKITDTDAENDEGAEDKLVRIIDDEEEAGGELVRIIKDEKNAGDESDTITINEYVELTVNAQKNQSAADSFIRNFRKAVEEKMLAHANYNNYTEPIDSSRKLQELDFGPLREFANQWSLPFVVFARGRSHYYLLLELPRLGPDGDYQILVYDPLKDGREYLSLPQWDPNEKYLANNLAASNIYFNDLGYNALESGEYNLNLDDSQQPSITAALRAAKEIKIQFNDYDCGPACLFAAAILTAAKPGKSKFKELGIEQLDTDTSLTVLTREEIVESAQFFIDS